MRAQPLIDIFCRVVDNYGDIGVCWRLARRLALRSDCGPVRLWVDDLKSFARIAPLVSSTARTQDIEGITVLKWEDSILDTSALNPASLVIEAFACSPPAPYLARMGSEHLWLNLEYLSAEDWVESCHGLPSLQGNGLKKFFFFPGFTPATGGLLREPDLLARREAWQADPNARLSFLAGLGLSPAWLERLQAGARLIYVYCYANAPLPALLNALARSRRDTLVLMAEGIWRGDLPSLDGTDCAVAVHQHPFVDQDSFDRLLWSSELNIVRGEDSLVRALWAGRPMIWQPYLQEDDLHLDKLTAWLERSPFDARVRAAMLAWNRSDSAVFEDTLLELLEPSRLAHWQSAANAWCRQLASQPDLADQLLDFRAKFGQTR